MTGEGAARGGRFFAEVIAALRSVEAMPGVGSPLVGEHIGGDGLRGSALPISCGWFCIERHEHLDVIRLLADEQDLGGATA